MMYASIPASNTPTTSLRNANLPIDEDRMRCAPRQGLRFFRLRMSPFLILQSYFTKTPGVFLDRCPLKAPVRCYCRFDQMTFSIHDSLTRNFSLFFPKFDLNLPLTYFSQGRYFVKYKTYCAETAAP
jgi:hypothetical protein